MFAVFTHEKGIYKGKAKIKVQEHYAIVITKIIPSESALEALNEEEKNIYEEIIRTTLAMFHGDYEFEETTIITKVKDIEFYTKDKVEIKRGWKSLFSETKMTRKIQKSCPLY